MEPTVGSLHCRHRPAAIRACRAAAIAALCAWRWYSQCVLLMRGSEHFRHRPAASRRDRQDSCPRANLVDMARAVGAAVGWGGAPEAQPLARPALVAPRLGRRGAGVGAEPLPGGRQVRPADPAREALDGVVDPAARETGGVLELDEAAAASRAGPGMGDGRERRGSEG